MESKALEPTPGQIEIVSSFPKLEGKKLEGKKGSVRFPLWTLQELTDAESSELDEVLEYQCPILSIKHTSEKKLLMWLFFSEGWK